MRQRLKMERKCMGVSIKNLGRNEMELLLNDKLKESFISESLLALHIYHYFASASHNMKSSLSHLNIKNT